MSWEEDYKAVRVEAGKKARDTNKAKDPDFYKKIGAKGGSAKVPKGFAVTGLAREAGARGGRVSKRPSKKRIPVAVDIQHHQVPVRVIESRKGLIKKLKGLF